MGGDEAWKRWRVARGDASRGHVMLDPLAPAMYEYFEVWFGGNIRDARRDGMTWAHLFLRTCFWGWWVDAAAFLLIHDLFFFFVVSSTP